MTCFTVKIVAPAAPPKKTATLLRIRPPGALGPALWATWPPAARQNAVLSERPWLLSRARGGVRLGNAQHYRESTSLMAPGAVIYGISGDAVLRIRNTHGDLASRPADGPAISGIFGDAVFEIGDTHVDSTSRSAKTLIVSGNRSRVCRFCRVLSVRWGSGSSGSRAARRFCPARPQKRSIFEAQVAQFACGTPILPRRAVKALHI